MVGARENRMNRKKQRTWLVRVVTIIDALWVEISDGDDPVPWAGLGSTGGLFSGPLASSRAVRSVRHPPRRSCSEMDILPSIPATRQSTAYPRGLFPPPRTAAIKVGW